MAEVYTKPPVSNWSPAGVMLYVLAAPLAPAIVVALMKGSFTKLVVDATALVLLVSAARLVRRGLSAEREYNRRKIANAPTLPLKNAGALLAGVATALCSYFAVGNTVLFALSIGALASAGCYLAYGSDPRRAKMADTGQFGLSTEEVVEALSGAEKKIEAIELANRNISNTELSGRLRRITKQARQIIGTIEEDPRDIRRARKFLNVYLDGAQRVTEGYAHTHRKGSSEELDTNFRNVLVTIEEVFTEQHEKLRQNNELDLDVQIEVLATQLKREGVL